MAIWPLVKLLRPTQWLKNLMLFFPPFLGGALLAPGIAVQGTIPFFAFCLASSSTYVINDLLDRHNDALHDTKKHRPIPSGKVRVSQAWGIAALCLIGSLLLASLISPLFLLLTLSYLAVSSAYSLRLKEMALVDLFCICAGFLLRLEAGGEAFGIVVSEWLFLSVFLLAMFLATGKRLSEKILLGGTAGAHRKALLSYPDGFLEGVMYLSGGAVLVTYTMYVLSRHIFVYTVPLCCFGLLRYILRVKQGGGGDPTESLLKDRALLVVGLLWAAMIGYSLYGGGR